MTRLLAQRRVTAAVVALLVCQALAIAQAPQPDLERLAKTAFENIGAPGMSVAVVRDDALAWSAGFGLANIEHQIPARSDTVYRIASISKPIAATAVMQLVESGRVQLDDPIRAYVPSFPEKGELVITLRHLLTHTSGIRHYKPGEMENHETFDTIDAAIGIFKDDPLLFAPGSQYSYSSYAYNLLAGVVERASGLTYEAYLRQRIFEPSGMTKTRLEHPQEIVAGRADQYVRAGANAWRNAPYADLSVKWAGGGIISTAEDLAKFHIALDQGRLLETASMAEMYRETTLTGGAISSYGLGWTIQRDAEKHLWVAHSGGATGGTTYLLRSSELKLAVIILCNVENAPNLRSHAEAIARAALQVPATAAAR